MLSINHETWVPMSCESCMRLSWCETDVELFLEDKEEEEWISRLEWEVEKVCTCVYNTICICTFVCNSTFNFTLKHISVLPCGGLLIGSLVVFLCTLTVVVHPFNGVLLQQETTKPIQTDLLSKHGLRVDNTLPSDTKIKKLKPYFFLLDSNEVKCKANG